MQKIGLVIQLVSRGENLNTCQSFFFPISSPKEGGLAAGLAASNWVGWIQGRLHLGPEEPVQIFWSPGQCTCNTAFFANLAQGNSGDG